MRGLAPPASEWERFLSAFEQAIGSAEATGVVPRIDLNRNMGPIPVNLVVRARALAKRIDDLQSDVGSQMKDISGELSQVTHTNHSYRQPPPARHLDQLA